MKLTLLTFIGLATLASSVSHAQENAFPNRPVTIIVPFTSGSGSDTTARYFGEQLSKIFHQPFVVENRPGASGIIAVNTVKNAPPNGHTVLLASNSPISVNPVTIKNLPYDPVKDLKPIAGIARSMNGLVVSSNSEIKTLADLIAASKQKDVTVGTYSDGYRLALAWLSSLTGAKFTNVPYKGGTPIFTDVIGGHLDVGIIDMPAAMEMIKNGKLRAIAVSGESRYKDLPDVPTVKESGYAEYVNYAWASLYVRADTPDNITKMLADAMQTTLHTQATKDFIAKNGSEIMPYTPEAMRTYQNEEIMRFRKIAQSAGIKPQ